MYVVIFRARIRQFDEEYAQTATRLRELALNEFGCLEFQAVSEGEDEVALSYWPDLASIRAWKQQAGHQLAQRRGRERWYRSYKIEIAEITRSSDWKDPGENANEST